MCVYVHVSLTGLELTKKIKLGWLPSEFKESHLCLPRARIIPPCPTPHLLLWWCGFWESSSGHYLVRQVLYTNWAISPVQWPLDFYSDLSTAFDVVNDSCNSFPTTCKTGCILKFPIHFLYTFCYLLSLCIISASADLSVCFPSDFSLFHCLTATCIADF